MLSSPHIILTYLHSPAAQPLCTIPCHRSPSGRQCGSQPCGFVWTLNRWGCRVRRAFLAISAVSIELIPAPIHFDNSVLCDASTGCTSIPHSNRHYRTYTHTILAEETWIRVRSKISWITIIPGSNVPYYRTFRTYLLAVSTTCASIINYYFYCHFNANVFFRTKSPCIPKKYPYNKGNIFIQAYIIPLTAY